MVYFFVGARQLRIKKVINNNIICAVDEDGSELIATGRGLGFQRRTGERVDESLVQKVYRMVDRGRQRRLRELVEEIPLEHLALTEELVSLIRQQLDQPMNESLLITMADHISFAIRRQQQGIAFENPLCGAVMSYYPAEYRLGRECLRQIRERLGVELPESEASFLALHIVNAELNTEMSQMMDITRLIEGVIDVVEGYYGRAFDRDSLSFSRFVVHLRYFAQQLFQSRQMPDTADEHDVLFRQLIARNCKAHYGCAMAIAAYVREQWDRELSDEEMVYLTIHLKRVAGDGSSLSLE